MESIWLVLLAASASPAQSPAPQDSVAIGIPYHMVQCAGDNGLSPGRVKDALAKAKIPHSDAKKIENAPDSCEACRVCSVSTYYEVIVPKRLEKKARKVIERLRRKIPGFPDTEFPPTAAPKEEQPRAD